MQLFGGCLEHSGKGGPQLVEGAAGAVGDLLAAGVGGSEIKLPHTPAHCIRFRGKDGRWVQLSTGRVKKPQAIDEAHRAIREHYEEIAPTSETVSWGVAREKLRAAMTADNKRPKTISGYEETLGRLMAMFPLAKGPADITALGAVAGRATGL